MSRNFLTTLLFDCVICSRVIPVHTIAYLYFIKRREISQTNNHNNHNNHNNDDDKFARQRFGAPIETTVTGYAARPKYWRSYVTRPAKPQSCFTCLPAEYFEATGRSRNAEWSSTGRVNRTLG